MNVTDEATLCKIQNALWNRGEEVIERVPSLKEVISFLDKLRPYCDTPLSNQFFFSDRDGSICVRHEIRDPPKALFLDFRIGNPRPPVYIDLVTTSQDYTPRSNKPFSKTMKLEDYLKKNNSYRNGYPEYGFEVPELVQLIAPHFNRLQNYLLEREKIFLHVIRVDPIPKDSASVEQIVYLVETARRHRSEPEYITDSVELEQWTDMEAFKRRLARSEHITLWAIQEMIPTSKENDSVRLEYIQSVIKTEKIRENIRTGYWDMYRSQESIQMKGGNHIAMLRARHGRHADGRARFPVLYAALKDKSITRRKESPIDDSFSDEGRTAMVPLFHPGETYSLNDLEPKPKFQEKIVRYEILGKSAGVLLLSTIGSLCYLTRLSLSPDEGETVRSNAITLFFGLMAIFESLLIFYEYSQGRGLHRRATGADLWKQAVKIDKRQNTTRARVEAVRHPSAKEYFSGVNLSFVDGEDPFTGEVDVDHKFSLLDLLNAGYETTFSRDGSEILLGPKQRYRKMFRMDKLTSDGSAVLVEVKIFDPDGTCSDRILGSQTLDFTRAAWYQNITFA